jgi:hypothetical protein
LNHQTWHEKIHTIQWLVTFPLKPPASGIVHSHINLRITRMY